MKLISRLILSMVISLSFYISICYGVESRYVYISFGDGVQKYTINMESQEYGSVYRGRDIKSEAFFCNSFSRFICVISFDISFSVPKDIGNSIAEWEFDYRLYELVAKNVTLDILGHSYSDLYVISGPKSKFLNYVDYPYTQRKYIYSKEYGLLGFIDNNDGTVFWSVSEKGFGSQH